MSRLRVGFLYNHDAPHQVRHSAGVIGPLLARAPHLDVSVIASSDELLAAARALVPKDAGVLFVRLDLPGWHKPFVAALNQIIPFGRFDQLYSHRAMLRRFDVLVVTEGTSLFLKKLGGFDHVRFIRIDHGAGDRAIGYTRAFAGNDLVIVAGEKQQRRFLDSGVLRPEQIAVAGYPKFDTVDLRARPRLFENDKPVVLYNPHPEAHLSSWYGMGRAVLEFFYQSRDYNLIFAPHVMLFRRWLQVSPEFGAVRWPGRVAAKYRGCAHMIVDTGSAASVDMTYTLAADIYLGDVSSQVYEFLVRPRPCVFLNAHGARWLGNRDYACWELGEVVESVEGMATALKEARAEHAGFRTLQESAVEGTFSGGGVVKAAEVIAGFLGG